MQLRGAIIRMLLKLLQSTDVLARAMHQYAFQKLLGNGGRVCAWRLMGASISDGVRLGPGVRIRSPANVVIGGGTAIIGRIRIEAWGPVRIGRNVLLNDDVLLLTASHSVNSPDLEGDVRAITIGDYAWLPVRIVVLPGVSIGKAAVVGTGSVVSRDVPDYAVVAGNPARIVSQRARRTYRYVPSEL